MSKNLFEYRIPLEVHLDLTYRCNNNCLHCWLRIPSDSSIQKKELSYNEIRRIVDEARALGVRKWSISGGEPMLREDFYEIFDFITSKAVSYTLNTNGTLITSKIAQLLKRKGNKMVALYGATAETYDRVTRNPGGYEQLMQGLQYLKEAGADFVVQLVPMKDNWHEWEKMIEFAKSLSPNLRVGASWLNYSAARDSRINNDIYRQRLNPSLVVELDPPYVTFEESNAHNCGHTECNGKFFYSCIDGMREFHIDPYGGMSFCSYIKDPTMRYDLLKGTVCVGWEKFIPSLAEITFDKEEYKSNCGSCELREDCRWCAVYGWLEHGRFSAPVEYLCEVARENNRFKIVWQANHTRYFKIADITILLVSDLPIDDNTFSEKFETFRTEGPGEDTVVIRHHFGIPDVKEYKLGKEVYHKAPWAIFQQGTSYIYLGISTELDDPSLHRVATFNIDHNRARIYNNDMLADCWRKGKLDSLTMFPTDQILIARLLADRQGCYLHSAGAIIDGFGILFIGHSDAGKSTTTNFLIDASAKGEMQVSILCDDRNIVRHINDSWQVYGTWSHGDVPLVSSSNAPLRAICFIEQASENTILPIIDHKDILRRLLACVIRPFITADWWTKTLDIIEPMSQQVPCYLMRFDKSGAIVVEIKKVIEAEVPLLIS